MIQTHFMQPQFIKIYYSDPIKRQYIVGNHPQYEQHEDFTNVVFVYFPPHPTTRLDMGFLCEVCARCACPLEAWSYCEQDPQYKSYLLCEFGDAKSAETMRDFLGRNALAIFGDDKCEVGILPDDQKYPQNPQHKQAAPAQYATRQSQFRQQLQQKLDNISSGSKVPVQLVQHIPSPSPQPFVIRSYGILDELAPDFTSPPPMAPLYAPQFTAQPIPQENFMDVFRQFLQVQGPP